MYDPAIANLGEARLTAIKAILCGTNELADLNTALGRYSWAYDMVGVTASQFHIGECDRIWAWTPPVTDFSGAVPVIKVPATGNPLHFFVSAGGARDALSMTSGYSYIGAGQKEYRLYTSISGIIHPGWMNHSDPFAQMEYRELICAILLDWLRAVFNDNWKYQHSMITFTSKEFHDNSGSATDRIEGHIEGLYKGFFERGFAGTEAMWGVHAQHVGTIR